MTIPPDVAKHLDLDEKSKIVYIIDPESGYVTLGRADKIEIALSKIGKPVTLGFSVPKETVRRIARVGVKKDQQ